MTVGNASAARSSDRYAHEKRLQWMGCPTIHPSKYILSERWNGQTQNGPKIACSRIAIRTEKNIRHSITVRFAVRLNLTVIQVSTGRGRGLRSSRPSPRSTAIVTDSPRRVLGGGACTCCATRTPLMRRRAPCHCARIRSNVSPLGRVLFVTRYLSMYEFHCPRLTALDVQTTEARAHLKDCCTPRSPRVHVKSIARINGCMSA